MVHLNVKRGDDQVFLWETTTAAALEKLVPEVLRVYNDIRRLQALCDAIELIAQHGIALPPAMQGLHESQIEELKLVDEWAAKCLPSGGSVAHADPMGRRGGNAPLGQLAEMLVKTAAEARAAVGPEQAKRRVALTAETVTSQFQLIRGALTIVYPMGLPPHEPARQLLEDTKECEVADQIDGETGEMWWAGKQMERGKTVKDYIGANEKTTIVVKVQRKGGGAPGREPRVDEETQKRLMMEYHKRQEELKRLESEMEDTHLDSAWADPNSLRRQFQGIGNVSWK